MASGLCVGWKDGHGFGFLRPDGGGPDVFVLARDIVNADVLKQGQRVMFETVMDEKRGKQRADRVRVI
jgi:cold shock CspA family protein